jgi:hypothetical protein
MPLPEVIRQANAAIKRNSSERLCIVLRSAFPAVGARNPIAYRPLREWPLRAKSGRSVIPLLLVR